MLENKWLGDKTQQGFYKKEGGTRRAGPRHVLDWQTLDYKPSARPKFPAMEMAKNVEFDCGRIAQLLACGILRRIRRRRFIGRC